MKYETELKDCKKSIGFENTVKFLKETLIR